MIRNISILTLFICAVLGCASDRPDSVQLQGCVDHPPVAGFQNVESKQCFYVTGPDCVDGDTAQEINAIRNAEFAAAKAAYSGAEFTEFSAGYGNEENIPADCIFTD